MMVFKKRNSKQHKEVLRMLMGIWRNNRGKNRRFKGQFSKLNRIIRNNSVHISRNLMIS